MNDVVTLRHIGRCESSGKSRKFFFHDPTLGDGDLAEQRGRQGEDDAALHLPRWALSRLTTSPPVDGPRRRAGP